MAKHPERITHTRGPSPTVELRTQDLLRRGSKLAQDSRQLVSDAKRLLDTSAKLISSSHERKRAKAQ